MCLPEDINAWDRRNRDREMIVGLDGRMGDQNNNGSPGSPSGQDDGANANGDESASGGGRNTVNNMDQALSAIGAAGLVGQARSAFGNTAPTAPPSSVPGLPTRSTPALPAADDLDVAQQTQQANDPESAVNAGIADHETSPASGNNQFGKTPSEQNATATRGNADDTNYGGKNDSDPTGSTGSPAGSTAAQSPDQDNTGGMGIGSTANSAANPNAPSGEMSATGTAPGVGSGENETSAGPGSSGGGGDGGGGMGGIGGMGMGDHGVGGSQGSENGQGGYRMGTADTGDDGDMMMDEEVDPPVHENEAVLPQEMRDDIGKDILDEAISLYQDDGLTRRERIVALKDLFGEWAARK